MFVIVIYGLFILLLITPSKANPPPLSLFLLAIKEPFRMTLSVLIRPAVHLLAISAIGHVPFTSITNRDKLLPFYIHCVDDPSAIVIDCLGLNVHHIIQEATPCFSCQLALVCVQLCFGTMFVHRISYFCVQVRGQT
jgi:hypothetical protein